MVFPNLLWQLGGVLAIAGAVAASLVHREVYIRNISSPASPWEAALALVSFLLASYGILLLIYGRRLHQRRNATLRVRVREEETTALSQRQSQNHDDCLRAWIASDAFAWQGNRAAIASALVYRALAARSIASQQRQ